MKRFAWIVLGALALTVIPARSAEIRAVIDQPTIPHVGRTITDFVPQGYEILEKVEADFNGDELPDEAMILRPTITGEMEHRPLIILLAEPGGGYALSARNDRIAIPVGSGALVNLDGEYELKTEGKSLIVSNDWGGSDDMTEVSWEFALLKGRWYEVSTETSYTSRRPTHDLGSCYDDLRVKIPLGWHCIESRAKIDLRSGQAVDSWTFVNEKADKDQTQSVERKVGRKELRRFEDIIGEE